MAPHTAAGPSCEGEEGEEEEEEEEEEEGTRSGHTQSEIKADTKSAEGRAELRKAAPSRPSFRSGMSDRNENDDFAAGWP